MSSELPAPKWLRWWFPEAPAERLAMLRILVGLYAVVYLLIRIKYLLSFAERPAAQFVPVGPLAWMDAPIDPGLYRVAVIATIVAGILFLIGWAYRWTAPVFAALLWTVLTYSNSWGTVLHTDNLLLLHVLVLTFASAADALSVGARPNTVASPSGRYGWPIRLMCWVCVLVYLLAGIAKVRNSGWEFVSGESLRNYVAMAAVRKIELGSVASPFAEMVLPYARAFQVLAAGSLAFELGAPLAMLHRRAGVLWSFVAWAFHLGVLIFMAIGFFYPLTFVAFAPFFRVERLLKRFRHR